MGTACHRDADDAKERTATERGESAQTNDDLAMIDCIEEGGRRTVSVEESTSSDLSRESGRARYAASRPPVITTGPINVPLIQTSPSPGGPSIDYRLQTEIISLEVH